MGDADRQPTECAAGGGQAGGGPAAVAFFKKRAGPSKNLRKKREASPMPAAAGGGESGAGETAAAEDGADGGTVLRTKIRRENAHNPFVQATRSRKVRADGTSDATDEAAADRPPQFMYKAAKRLVAQQSDGGATRYAEWDPETDREAKALLDRHHADVAAEDDGLYRGLSEYKSFVPMREDRPSNTKIKAGPIRAPANVRAISVIDYQPDICKDYKETGYCGYGDSCKFMHDRGDYKSGWQLEKEWREKGHIGKRGKNEYELEGSDSDSDDELPFACLICREEFKRPVKTKCSHYFCETCALAHYAKTNKCFACQAPTGGVFNTAKDLLVKLAEKKKRMEEEGTRDPPGDERVDYDDSD